MSFDAPYFIGQQFDPSTNQFLLNRWLVQRRYLNIWKSRGHRVVRPSRPEDGEIPLRPNGQREWAVPISKAIKFKGEVVAESAPPAEATTILSASEQSSATTEPAIAKPRKRRARA